MGRSAKKSDGYNVIVAVVVFCGVMAAAKLFFWILAAFGAYLVYYIYGKAKGQARSATVMGCACAVVVIAGVCYWFCNYCLSPAEALVPPTIEVSVHQSGFYKDNAVTLREDGDTVYIEVSDNRYYNRYMSRAEIGEKAESMIDVNVVEKDARMSSEDPEVTITGGIERSGYKYNSFSNKDFKLGSTVFTVTARNSKGEAKKVVVVTKTGVEGVCQKRDGNYTGLSKSEKEYCEAWKYYVDKEAGLIESTPNVKPSSNPGSSSGGSSCVHYEAGVCWDDIENEAYSSGQWDKTYGYEGGAYAPPDGCSGLCEDIYEDAYYQGYDE